MSTEERLKSGSRTTGFESTQDPADTQRPDLHRPQPFASGVFGSYDPVHDGAKTDDWTSLESLIQQFYAVICFPEGGEPDWLEMQKLFSPHARITRITPEGIDYLDLEAFRRLVEELLEVGAITSLFEEEIDRRVERYGRVFHVASAYETKVAPEALDYLERGVNSLQIIKEGAGWRILSLCWDTAAMGPSTLLSAGSADMQAFY